MALLNTTSDDSIYESLDMIFQAEKGNTKTFLDKGFSKISENLYSQIELDSLYSEFSLPKDFVIEYVTIHHITTRLGNVNKEEFLIDNLETVLLTENTLTSFFKKYDIEFKRELGINVYYRKRFLDLTSLRNHRLQSRLTNLEDSCVNGFLLPEQIPHIYKELTAMPEILSDLATSLRRLDLQNEYFSKKKCYIASIKVPIVDLTFDDFQYETDSIEKTKLILIEVCI